MTEDVIIDNLVEEYYIDIVDYSLKPLIIEEILVDESTSN